MNWTSIVANLVTGIASISAVVISFFSARTAIKAATEQLRTSIAAEDARAKLAEKRRIYAEYLSSLTKSFHASAVARYQGNKRSKEFQAAEAEANRTRIEAMHAVGVVRLICSREVSSLASSTLMSLVRVLDGGTSHIEFVRELANLTLAMRMDLGEPGPPDVTSLEALMLYLGYTDRPEPSKEASS